MNCQSENLHGTDLCSLYNMYCVFYSSCRTSDRGSIGAVPDSVACFLDSFLLYLPHLLLIGEEVPSLATTLYFNTD